MYRNKIMLIIERRRGFYKRNPRRLFDLSNNLAVFVLLHRNKRLSFNMKNDIMSDTLLIDSTPSVLENF